MRIKILYISIVVLFMIVVLEGFTRLFLVPSTDLYVVPPEVGRFDQLLGWSNNPNSKSTSNRTGEKIEYKINSKGLRDDETTYEKPDSIFRIVALGDSRTFGFGVPIEMHYTSKIESYFKNVEVINMGVSGFGVDQELIYLQVEGLRYQPDIVLAYVPHYKDHRHMHSERWGRQKPKYILVNDELILTNSIDPESPPDIFRRINRWIRKYSAAYNAVYSGINGLIADPKHTQTKLGQFEEDRKNLEDESFRKELFDLGEAIINEMNFVAESHGSKFILVTQIDELYDACLDRNILSLNVDRALTNPKFILPDSLSHINEIGNGVLAWEITKFLETSQLVPPEHQIMRKPKF